MTDHRAFSRTVLLGMLALTLGQAWPARAGERILSEQTVSSGTQVEMKDGKLQKRQVRRIKDEVEVDIQVPVTRTRQDPITRYVPNASPLS